MLLGLIAVDRSIKSGRHLSQINKRNRIEMTEYNSAGAHLSKMGSHMRYYYVC